MSILNKFHSRSASILLASTWLAAHLWGADSSRLAIGEHDAPVNDVQLHYTIAGHGPLVFVCSPGWGPGSLYLQRGLAPLEEHYTLLFIDTRGSGKSSKPADVKRMSGSDMADDIEGLRRYLALDKISLLGHSDSGAIALYYAERYPSALAKLIIVDGLSNGSTDIDNKEDENLQKIREGLSNDPRYKEALRPFKPTEEGDAGMQQQLQHDAPISFADPAKNGPRFAQTIEGMIPSSFAAQAHAAAGRAQHVEGTAHLGDIKATTLIVVGKEDWLCPVMDSEDLHQQIHGSQLVEIDGSGHFPWIEQPIVFFKSVNAFLKD